MVSNKEVLICKICKKQTNSLENHHIIPKSRGGLDNEDNIIKVCIECHGKAHNVSFSENRKGLTIEGLNKYKDKLENAHNWIQNPINEKKVQDKILQLHDNDLSYKAEFILELIEKEMLNSIKLMEWVEKGKTKVTIILD